MMTRGSCSKGDKNKSKELAGMCTPVRRKKKRMSPRQRMIMTMMANGSGSQLAVGREEIAEQLRMLRRQRLNRCYKPSKAVQSEPRRKMSGLARCFGPEQLSSDETRDKMLKYVQLAIDWYNHNHKGDEIQLVEFIALVAGGIRRRFVHINFMARSISASNPDQCPKRYFAEVRVWSLDNLEPTVCVQLGEDSVNGCILCSTSYNVAHPPSGFSLSFSTIGL